MGRNPGAVSIPGRPFRFVLGVESERDREEHGKREDVLGEAVRLLRAPSASETCGSLRSHLHSRSYNDDISLEDAIHTALLTLKEGFEGHMTEKTIEIGIVTVPSQAELEAGKIEGTGRVKPTFRKLSEEEVRDYLAM